ncbi:acyl carrier protein phosphodiesterase [Zophobihabitans entericus]|uniref:DUF479 domain-containing protein n=1 Tax=Zophobihabitans entericus TaxID=1635327 RepID=A0A6G9ICI9_9GAMM|nr:ACP phosphodiesterase [Zophobihabitans entericus]QIQ21948.1 DUF479 domain-containing protein [Zophobihabitans entericus]
MNVLAHLHLATLAQSSLVGNVVADFVKGNPYQQYHTVIADGIMMHRRIDAMIDNIPEVRQAKSLFATENQRVAFITLDVVWDHFLSKHWSQFMKNSTVTEFSEAARQQILPDFSMMPESFQRFMSALWRENWLEEYRHIEAIDDTLSSMAKRRPKLSALKDSFTDFTLHYDALEQLFFQFYPRLIELAKNAKL